MAARLAASIERRFGIRSKLVAGHGGILEVALDGKVVWTNRPNPGTLPTDDEVLAAFPEAG